MFIVDFTGDFLNEILHCDDAGKSAVLVDEHRYLPVGRLHLLEENVDVLALGHQVRRVQDAAHIHLFKPVFARLDDKIFHIKHADDVVGVPFVNRDAGVFCREQLVEILAHRAAGIDEKDVGPGGHDLLRDDVVKLKNAVDHFGFSFVKYPGFLSNLHHGLDLFFGNLFVKPFGLHAEEAQHQVGGEGEKTDKRRGNRLHQQNRLNRKHRNRLRLLQGDPLGDELAEDKGKIGQEQRNRDKGDRLGIGNA